MAQEPRRPQDWRDWVRADYEYPDDFDDMSWSQRRRARRRWRRQDQAQRIAWLRDRRGEDPAGPGGVVVAIVLLAVVVIGFGAALPRLLHGDNDERPSIGLLTPAPNSAGATGGPGGPVSESSGPAVSDSSTPSASPSPTPTPLPVTSNRVSAAQVSAAGGVVSAWATVFYTRNPATETYEQLVAKAGRYTTDAVSTSFITAGDSTYEALRTSHGTSRVLEAPVTAPRKGTAPVDTPSRISRLVSVKIQVTGARPATLTVPLLVTLVPQDGDWVISDVNGGAGT